MTSVAGRFQRDLLYLQNNQIPITSTGAEITSLSYQGEEYEKLTDEDVRVLCEALMKNDKFSGPLDLSDNNLTDLSALYIADVIEKQDGRNITDLNLSRNLIQDKAGMYIGDALANNEKYPIQQILFKGVNLKLEGSKRLFSSLGINKNVKRLHIGVISNESLQEMGSSLSKRPGLIELEFQEDEAKPWALDTMQSFTSNVKVYSELEVIKFIHRPLTTEEDEQRYAMFKQEIDFYCKKQTQQHQKMYNFEERQKEIDTDKMFESILNLIENKDLQKKMPVRKFFNNTFGTIINDAIFALKKKQSKEPQNEEICTKKGSVKFVAMYILENLPQHEREPDLYDSSDSREDN
eukprot:403333876